MAASAATADDDTTTTTKLLQQPSHEHPLEPLELSILHLSTPPSCILCHWKVSGDAFTCRVCQTYYHRVCVEAPPKIERHPLHPHNPLILTQHQNMFFCNTCAEKYSFGGSSFRCKDCDFDLDLSCALSNLSRGDSSQGTTPAQIYLPLHPHYLTSFFARDDFVWGSNCLICQEHVKEDGYFCLRRGCDFLIHKRCVQDLQCADGTKAPRVYHGHPLETLTLGEETDPRKCVKCGSDALGEFIGCPRCEVFIHKDCIPVKDTLQYPPHPGHSLVLFICQIGSHELQCQSCSSSIGGELCYRCFSCEFFLHVECAHQTLAYCEKGMRVKIENPWHAHPLVLCHRINSVLDHCSSCYGMLNGPTYICNVQNCAFLLHKQCAELEPIVDSTCHPDHPITLHKVTDGQKAPLCGACCRIIVDMFFSCELCALYLHYECAYRAPNLKHYLHQHGLLRFNELASKECNRCGLRTDSPTFRCVRCDFNLHEKCLELPPVVEHKTHIHHPLTLRATYIDDYSGEYYCDRCGKRRDGLLGAYVCEQCKLTLAFHIECVLPELQKVYVKKQQNAVIKRLADDITRKREQVHATEEKLEEGKRKLEELGQELVVLKRELEDLAKKHTVLISEQEKS